MSEDTVKKPSIHVVPDFPVDQVQDSSKRKVKPGFRLDQVQASIERNQKLVLIGQAFVACHNVFEKSDCSESDIIEFDTVFQRLYNQVMES